MTGLRDKLYAISVQANIGELVINGMEDCDTDKRLIVLRSLFREIYTDLQAIADDRFFDLEDATRVGEVELPQPPQPV